MKRIIAALIPFALVATAALAADNPVSCQGASCKVTVNTRTSGNVNVVAAQYDGTGAATVGPTSADTLNHNVRGHVYLGTSATQITAANANYRLLGNKKASSLYADVATSAAGVSAGIYFDGTSFKYSTLNQSGATLAVNGGLTTTSDSAFLFRIGNSFVGAADSAVTLTTVGDVTAAGAWTVGVTGQPMTAPGGVKVSSVSPGNATLSYHAYAPNVNYTFKWYSDAVGTTCGGTDSANRPVYLERTGNTVSFHYNPSPTTSGTSCSESSSTVAIPNEYRPANGGASFPCVVRNNTNPEFGELVINADGIIRIRRLAGAAFTNAAQGGGNSNCGGTWFSTN